MDRLYDIFVMFYVYRRRRRMEHELLTSDDSIVIQRRCHLPPGAFFGPFRAAFRTPLDGGGLQQFFYFVVPDLPEIGVPTT